MKSQGQRVTYLSESRHQGYPVVFSDGQQLRRNNLWEISCHCMVEYACNQLFSLSWLFAVTTE